MPVGYTQVFGGQLTYPAQLSLLALTMDANVVLQWPTELASTQYVVADIVDVTATTPGLTITMPAANNVTVGMAVLFNNVGAQTVTILDAAGGTILSLASGLAWDVYLYDNTTSAGSWRISQRGATVSVVNAAALAGAGLKAIGSTLNQSMPISTVNTSYTFGSPDRAKLFIWNGGSGALTLPLPGDLGNDWFVQLRNGGSGAITVTPLGGQINGTAVLTMNPQDSVIIATDGVNYYTVGGTASSTVGFDYTAINVSGSGNYTLSGSELNRIAYDFTGTLTGNREIIVPATVQQYWVANDTTGAFTLSLRTATQPSPGVTIGQGQRGIFYCNGTIVVDADTSTVSTPIAIADGGTGAVTAAGARINLGGTSTGIALFTAASAAAARTTLGVPTVDDSLMYAAALG